MSCGSSFGTFSLSLAARVAEGVRFYIFRRFARRGRAGGESVRHFSPFARGAPLVGWSSFLQFSSFLPSLHAGIRSWPLRLSNRSHFSDRDDTGPSHDLEARLGTMHARASAFALGETAWRLVAGVGDHIAHGLRSERGAEGLAPQLAVGAMHVGGEAFRVEPLRKRTEVQLARDFEGFCVGGEAFARRILHQPEVRVDVCDYVRRADGAVPGDDALGAKGLHTC